MYNPAFVSLLLPITIATQHTPPAIAGMMPFYTHGAMWADKHIQHTKRLDDVTYRVTYTVYSYREAIAEIVVELDEVHNILSLAKAMNPNKYSRTTSKHQGYVRRAFDLMQ